MALDPSRPVIADLVVAAHPASCPAYVWDGEAPNTAVETWHPEGLRLVGRLGIWVSSDAVAACDGAQRRGVRNV
jgi:hypothetical protein